MTIHKAFHQKDDTDRLYQEKNKKELPALKNCMDTAIQGPEKYPERPITS